MGGSWSKLAIFYPFLEELMQLLVCVHFLIMLMWKFSISRSEVCLGCPSEPPLPPGFSPWGPRDQLPRETGTYWRGNFETSIPCMVIRQTQLIRLMVKLASLPLRLAGAALLPAQSKAYQFISCWFVGTMLYYYHFQHLFLSFSCFLISQWPWTLTSKRKNPTQTII